MCNRIPPKAEHALSRRRFLAATASVASGSLLAPLSRAFADKDLHMAIGTARSRVVRAQNPRAVSGFKVHRSLVADMLDQSLTALTGANTMRQAWRTILAPDDVIGVKFNRSGQSVIASTLTVADVLIASLVDAGWPSRQIVCIEAPAGMGARSQTTPAYTGYASVATEFGSGADHFASVLGQITALIDVPFLKTHNVAGMTCALKNLSHGLIKHPARYHGQGCSPYIADIVASDPIRTKLRLCLVDALRIVFDGGPGAKVEAMKDAGILLTSLDPVATDTVGLAVLNDIRRGYNLSPIARSAEELGYLAAAHRLGLGTALWHGIDLIELRR